MDSSFNEHIRAILETDRIWCGYAIADLDPQYRERCEWVVGGDAVILVYRGLEPPILFAHGEPSQITKLADDLKQGEFAYTLTGTYRAALRHRLQIATEERMWRMAFKDKPNDDMPEGVERLSEQDQIEVKQLFARHADRPDAYHHEQLESGVYYGIRDGNDLVAIAGTHVISDVARLAAVGNVFTHPDHRNRGYGRRTSAAVLATLQRREIETIILNVGMDNQPAVGMYQSLGFMPYCGYYEGSAAVLPS
jgi:ribosomal protein S18 acetylase RimI-like enzyme